jgi:D-inositol-3-phosphate glycosyltransferase
VSTVPAQQSSNPDRFRIEFIDESGRAAQRIGILAGELARTGHDVSVQGGGTAADVVHAYGWESVAALGVPGEAAVIATLDPPGPDIDPGTVALGQSYDRIIAPSSEAARALLAVGIRRDRLGVVPDGVDTRIFHAGADGPGLRAEDRQPRILGVRKALSAPMVLDLLISLRRVPEARLFIAGGPSPQRVRQDDGAREVAKAAQRIGVANRVFLLGEVAPDRMPELYRTADVVVCTGEPDAARITLEAMACAVPVVAFAEGPVADIITHGVSGILVERGNAASLANAVRGLLASEPRRYAYAVGGLSRVQERFTWPRVAEQLEGFYRAALSDRQGRPAVIDF